MTLRKNGLQLHLWCWIPLLCLLLGSFSLLASPPPLLQIAASINRTTLTEQVEQQLQTAYQALGFQVSFVYLPPERSLRMSNRGEFDGELFRIESIRHAYPELIQVPHPVAEIRLFAWQKFAGNTLIAENAQTAAGIAWQQNPNLLIGYVRGFKLAEHYPFRGKRVVMNNAEQALRMLLQGKIDLWLEDETTLQAVLNQQNTPIRFYPATDALAQESVYHFVHQRHHALVVPLSEQLKRQQGGKNLRKSASDNGLDQ